ncbi:hypothetical protein QE152_g8001 [Popillia japonica]|uniref:PiggyBac transposable element-derived protein domain-containing protein n=1 Tax=Popillia japonica TaxID=7064 RepID=A0AAW1M6G3_POPJA
MPLEVIKSNLRRGELVAREDRSGIVILKWKDTRDVRLLSTKHAPLLVPVTRPPKPNTRSHIRECEELTNTVSIIEAETAEEVASTLNSSQQIHDPTQPSTSTKALNDMDKPTAVLDYNKGKSGIDLSDQMGSYVTTLPRKGVKWYRKLGVELLSGEAAVNAHVVYNKTVTRQKIQITDFRERLVVSLLQLQPLPGMPKTSQHLLLDRMDISGKKIRRKCVLCYAKISKELGRTEARFKNWKAVTCKHYWVWLVLPGKILPDQAEFGHIKKDLV